jgi:hypothetical protein
MATLDPTAVIVKAKLTEYLLVPLTKDDKSQFLAIPLMKSENQADIASERTVGRSA